MEHSILITFLIVSLAAYRLRKFGTREQGLPPGPKGIPVLGNALQFPTSYPHLRFTEWAREFGEIYSLKLLDRTAVILSSPEAVKHILEVKGSVTGNRPASHIIERATDGMHLVLVNMNTSLWKRGKKAIHNFLTPNALKTHLKTQEVESLQLLHDLMHSPQDIFTHIRRLTASTMFSLIYGVRFSTYHNSPPESYFEGVKLLNEAADPGAHPPIDIFPFLKILPGKWKELCERTKSVREQVYDPLLKNCEDRMREGKEPRCFIERFIEEKEKLGAERKEIWAAGSVLMDAGAETTASYLQSAVLSLINFPECQKKVQNDIDEVVGDRMPTLEDVEQLPYLKACIKEVMRYRPILPVGVPHVATEDVTYKDYLIPKDSIIFMNTFGILHDPDLFDDPETFNPDRYFNSILGLKDSKRNIGIPLRENTYLGAGRRLCPGGDMAIQTVNLNVLRLLWAFSFQKDDSGTGGMGTEAYAKPGLELAPEPFTCKIEVRSLKRARMINEAFASCGSI